MSTPALQTALISGASSGIGRALARVFAENGFDLVLVARNRDRLNELALELQPLSPMRLMPRVMSIDLFDPAAPARLFDELQKQSIHIDVLVNNAGLGLRAPFAETDLSQMLQIVQLNVVSVTHLTRLFLPSMVDRGFGRILNVSSIAAFLPGPLTAVYNASKAYVLSLSEALANELRPTGVSVTALCPGPTKTQFVERAGVEHTRAFQGELMDAAQVAQEGFEALQAGKRVVIPGMRNKMRMIPLQLVPRSLLADFSRRYHQDEPHPGDGEPHANWWQVPSWPHWWRGRKKDDGMSSVRPS